MDESGILQEQQQRDEYWLQDSYQKKKSITRAYHHSSKRIYITERDFAEKRLNHGDEYRSYSVHIHFDREPFIGCIRRTR